MYRIYGIMAMDRNGGVGYNNQLPWPHLPADMRYFKNVTSGNTVVMGRKTWESMGSKPLPNRVNVVLTRGSSEIPGTDLVVNSLSTEQLGHIFSHFERNIYIIGGPSIIKEYADILSGLHITHIDAEFECDTFFDQNILNRFVPVSNIEYTLNESEYALTMTKYFR